MFNPNAFNYNSEATLNDIVPVCEYKSSIRMMHGGDGWGNCYIGVTQGRQYSWNIYYGTWYYHREFGYI